MKPEGSVGKSIPRIDALEKACGTAVFTTDLKLPGMLVAKVLRSPYPHARIVSIDTAAAAALPGVRAVATYENTTQCFYNSSCSEANPPAVPVEDEQLFNRELRYVGDDVAAVAADTEDIANQALRLIKVEYEELPAVFDPLEAMSPEAPSLHQCFIGNNIAGMAKLPMGDLEKGFEESDVIVEEQFKLPVVKHCQLETQAAVASYTPSGRLTVWSTTQSPHPLKALLAKMFDLPASQVRVLNPPYIGGAFGSHVGMSGKAEAMAAALTILSGKPVRMVYTRKEDFIASTTRHSGYVTVKLGAGKDGKFKALYIKAILNTGAYANAGPDVTAVLGVTNASIYQIPNVLYDGFCVYTNTTMAGAMRGFGNPQGNFAVESTVDIMAERLGIDPVKLRLNNVMTPYAPWLPPYPCATAGLAECLEKGAAAFGFYDPNRKREVAPGKVRGIGVAAGTHVSNSWPFAVEFDNAYVTVQEDGSANLAVGVPDMGQGIATTLSQVAASALGIQVENMRIVFGDTDSTPFDIGSHASRTLYSAGTAVNAAAKDAKTKILEFVAEQLHLDGISRLTLEDGIISLDGKPKMSIKEAAHLIHRSNRQIIGVGQTVPFNAPPWHAHFAEVEVDLETGQVEVIRFVAAHDVGRAINPDIVEGQIQGSILQGIGYALSEQIVYDKKGRQAQDSFHKYYLPTIQETPQIDVILVETNEPSGPFGAKGVGECGLVPTAAAIANAVKDATGIRFLQIPITEERVLEALHHL